MKKGEKMSDKQRLKLSKAIRGHTVSLKTKEKIRKKLKGRKLKKEIVEKMRLRLGEKSGGWKGDRVGYHGVHKWMNRMRGRPRYCEICKRTGKKRYEWANKDHTHKRIIKDYMRLCQSCHVEYDKKFNHKYAKGNN